MRLPTITLLGALIASAAGADQRDPRLDELFSALAAAPGPAAAEPIADQIWAIWREVGDGDAREMFDRGLTAMEAREYKSAIDTFGRLIERRPDFAEAWNRRATLYYLVGEYARSVADIVRVLELEPRHFGALSGLGLIYMRIGEPEAAVQAFERALEVNPHLPGAQSNLESLRRQLKRHKT